MFKPGSDNDITWLFIGNRNNIFGLHTTSAEEMLRMAARGELKNDTPIRPATDPDLHSFAEWKHVCAGLNPFLVDCQSFAEMEKLAINDRSKRMFRFPHMLIPSNFTMTRKNVKPRTHNRAPRKPFLSDAELIRSPNSSSSTEDHGYNTSCDDPSPFHPSRRTISSITSNFLATLEDTGARRKSRYHMRSLMRKANVKESHVGKSVMTEPIIITESKASEILSELLGLDVEIV